MGPYSAASIREMLFVRMYRLDFYQIPKQKKGIGAAGSFVCRSFC